MSRLERPSRLVEKREIIYTENNFEQETIDFIKSLAKTAPEFDGAHFSDAMDFFFHKFLGWHDEVTDLATTLNMMPDEILVFVSQLCTNFIQVRNEWCNTDKS